MKEERMIHLLSAFMELTVSLERWTKNKYKKAEDMIGNDGREGTVFNWMARIGLVWEEIDEKLTAL